MLKTKKIPYTDVFFFAALLLRTFALGLTYYPTLDDFIPYVDYPMYNNLHHVYFTIGSLATRPMATLLDPVLWAGLYRVIWLPVLVISVLQFLFVHFTDKTLQDHGIFIRPFLYLFCLLLPINFEGTYWISASTRIVLGMFFAALAAWAQNRGLFCGKKRYACLFVGAFFAACGFYEGVIAYAFGFCAMIALAYVLKNKQSYKYPLRYMLYAVVCVLCYGLWYKFAPQIMGISTRAGGFSLSGMPGRVVSLIKQTAYIITAGVYRTTVCGMADGIRFMFSSGWGICIFGAICVLSLCIARSTKTCTLQTKPKICIVCGAILFALPLSANILVPDVWVTYRIMTMCIPGLVLMLSPLLTKICKRKYARYDLIFVLSFMFLCGSVNELAIYRKVSERDDKLLEELAQNLSDAVLAGEQNVILLTEQEVITPQTSYYKDHVKTVFYCDWALTGAIRAKCNNIYIKMMTPVYSLADCDIQGKQVLYLDKNDQIYDITNEAENYGGLQ